jgi:hypothetical protein
VILSTIIIRYIIPTTTTIKRSYYTKQIVSVSYFLTYRKLSVMMYTCINCFTASYFIAFLHQLLQ